MFLQRKKVIIRLWDKQEEYEQIGSWEATVAEVWCRRGAGNGFMENDKVGAPGRAGKAWAGRIEGRAGRHGKVWEAMDRSAVEGWTFQDAAAR